ncbi:MAG: HAD family hydrolase [Kiritimatiellaeota bacterium]|nr:HAD family hydrolase [Kiritimatiellota bacterium]
MRYELIIFDMDGTLTVPALDFAALRDELGIQTGDILLELERCSEERRFKALEVIKRHESAAASAAEPQKGCVEFLKKLCRAECKTAILTRNSRESVDSLLAKLAVPFDSILTREHPHVKPSPMPVLHILDELEVAPSSALVVGDYIHDLESGKAAGTETCFFRNPEAVSFAEFADFTVSSYAELDGIVFGK